MIRQGDPVEHSEFGPGTVLRVLGNTAQVDFFGERFDVEVADLHVSTVYEAPVRALSAVDDQQDLSFRRAFEAMNLGVVPPDPLQLIALTIGGVDIEEEARGWFANAALAGLCKVFFGYYGTGKSHHLQLVKAVALRAGWVTAYLEFDPKAADPANPHLVYRALMSSLAFPERANGEHTRGFFGFVKEIRNNWTRVRDGRYVKASPWFKPALEVLQYFPHQEDQDYVSAVGWLAGQVNALPIIRALAKQSGRRSESIPRMPQVKETAEIYVFHLVVLNELCRALGYKGLALILDEAEHVRGFNVQRRERANNFFDLLARTAHTPLKGDSPPTLNAHYFSLPPYWRQGPHFALFVGLTEGAIFSDPSLSIRDACVFLHQEADRIRLEPPSGEDYERWCNAFFAACYRNFGSRLQVLDSPGGRERIARVLRSEFDGLGAAERILRQWVKLASFVPSVLLSGNAANAEELESIVRMAARKVTGYDFPWDL